MLFVNVNESINAHDSKALFNIFCNFVLKLIVLRLLQPIKQHSLIDINSDGKFNSERLRQYSKAFLPKLVILFGKTIDRSEVQLPKAN